MQKKDGAHDLTILDYPNQFPKRNALVDGLNLATLRVFVDVTIRKGYTCFRRAKPEGV